MRSFLNRHQAHFDGLAAAWLADGATQFGVWHAGGPIKIWDCLATEPNYTPVPAKEQLTPCLCIGAGDSLELRVWGPPDLASRARLEADAAIITQLLCQERELDDLTSELIATQDQLLALYDLAKATRCHLDIPQTLRSLAHEAARLVESESAAVVLLSDDGEEWIGEGGCTSLGVCTDWLTRLLARVHLEGHELSSACMPPVYDDGPCPSCPDGVRDVFVTPVQVCDGWRAALVLLNSGDGTFPSPRRKLARAIAEQAGGQIENVVLYRQRLAQTRLETELELARSVQSRLLPQRLPVTAGLDIWAAARPALQVGGDFYDFAGRTDETLTFTVGDVAGKGVAAALLMAMTRTVFRSASGVHGKLSPAQFLDHASTHLYDDLTEVRAFVTMFVGQYEPGERRLVYANAGHSPVIYRAAGKPAVLLEADGPGVGVLPTNLCEDKGICLGPGDVLVVATDGFNDARGAGDEAFGIERMLRLIEEFSGRTAKEIALSLSSAVEAFAAGKPQEDDQTLVVLKGTSS